MPNAVKEKFVADLTEELKKSDQILVTDYQGLNSEEFNELRNKLRPLGAKYTVVKNRLAAIALKNVGCEALAPHLKGPSAIAYQAKDASALAKELSGFGADHKNLKLKAGYLYGMVANAQQLVVIAGLPSRNVLLSTLLARMNGPLQTLVSTLQEPVRSLSAALSAVSKKKEATPAQ